MKRHTTEAPSHETAAPAAARSAVMANAKNMLEPTSNFAKSWQFSRPSSSVRCQDVATVSEQPTSSSSCVGDSVSSPSKRPRPARSNPTDIIAKLDQEKAELIAKVELLSSRTSQEQQVMKCAAKAIHHWKGQCDILQHKLKTQQADNSKLCTALQERLVIAKELAIKSSPTLPLPGSSSGTSNSPTADPDSSGAERRRLLHKVDQLEREVVNAWAEQASAVAVAKQPLQLQVLQLQQKLVEAQAEHKKISAAAAGALKGLGEVVVSLLAKHPADSPFGCYRPACDHAADPPTTSGETINSTNGAQMDTSPTVGMFDASPTAAEADSPPQRSGVQTSNHAEPAAVPAACHLIITEAQHLAEALDGDSASCRSDQCVHQTKAASAAAMDWTATVHHQRAVAAQHPAIGELQDAHRQVAELTAALAAAERQRAELAAERDSMRGQLRSSQQYLKQCRQWWTAAKARHVERMEAAALKLQCRCDRLSAQMEALHQAVRGCERCSVHAAAVMRRAAVVSGSCDQPCSSLGPPPESYPRLRLAESCM